MYAHAVITLDPEPLGIVMTHAQENVLQHRAGRNNTLAPVHTPICGAGVLQIAEGNKKLGT